MANPSKSLNSLVSWSRLLPTLGVEDIRTTILPAATPCPLCGGDRLRVYDDPVVGGQWGNCESCHFAGDMVELAAKAWDLDAAAALLRLAARGVVDGELPAERIEGYVRDHVEYRKRLNMFWQEARQRPRRNVPRAVCHLLRKFGVLDLAGSPAWPYHAGQVVGSAHRHQIEDLFHPGSYAVRPRSNGPARPSVRRGPGAGPRLLFRGEGWEDVLVVAFCDLPGRVSGLLCIGREADPEAGDIIFKAANFRPNCRGFQEAGLGLWPGLEQGLHPHLGNTLFVIAEPMVALRLQLRHLRAATVPLPIVMSWHAPGARTEEALSNLAGRELVFWGPNPYVLRQARSVDGLVSTYVISQREIARTLCHRQPLDWLRMIKQDAMPWKVATYHALRQGNQSSTEATLRELEFSPTAMRDFVNGCPLDLRDQVAKCSPYRVSERKVVVAGKTVVEKDAGWFLEKTGERIASAPIRIEEVLSTSQGRGYYRGRVRLEGEEKPFTVPVADVDRRGLLHCVRDELRAAGAGVLSYQDQWSRRAAQIALELSKPTLVTTCDRIGWHPDRRRFVFPRFSIAYGGGVGFDHLPLLREGNVPGRDLYAPACLMPWERDALCEDRLEVKIVWAVAACVLHNLMGPAMGYPPVAIVLDGLGAKTIGRAAARALGCRQVNLKVRQRREPVPMAIQRTCCRHGWPVVVRLPKMREPPTTDDWEDAPGTGNTILDPDPYTARVMAINTNFHVIRCEASTGVLGSLKGPCKKIIPAYLEDVCRRKLWVDRVTGTRIVDLLRDIAKWFKSSSGDEKAVLRAGKLIVPGGQRAGRQFAQLVSRLRSDGKVRECPEDQPLPEDSTPAIVRRAESESQPAAVWVPKEAINRLLGELGVPALDLPAISESLKEEEGVLLGEEKLGAEPGWLVSRRWWETQERSFRRAEVAAARTRVRGSS